MTNLFSSILVPVDFSTSAKVAVAKAIELANEETIIHLLHVHENVPFRIQAGSYKNLLGTEFRMTHQTNEERLNVYKTMVERSKKKVRVSTNINFGLSVQAGIVSESRLVNADLIIIGKRSRHSWFPFLNKVRPIKLSQLTSIPVLTVKLGSLNHKIKKIIVPITGQSTEEKLSLLGILGEKFRASVFLVTFMRDGRPEDFQGAALMHAYHETMEKMHLNVQYSVLHGQNKAKELLKLAQTINADMLLVYAGKETTIGWPNKQISDILLPESQLQVLSVKPSH